MVQNPPDPVSGFADQNVLLRSLYLMERDAYTGADRAGEASHLRFVAWYIVTGRHLNAAPAVVDRHLRDALTRPDRDGCHVLMRLLADANGLDLRGDRLRAWYYGEAVPHYRLGAMMGREEADLLTPSAAPRTRPDLPTVSIVGFHRSVLGIGEDARCLFDGLRVIGVAAELVDVSPPSLARIEAAGRYRPFEAPRPAGSVVIFCLPAFEMMGTLARLNLTLAPGQYAIGYWPWETTALPGAWRHAYDAVDEVWASSRFLQGVFAGATHKPVVHMPPHVRVDAPDLSADMEALFAEAYTFLNVFDFNSRVARKNPEGAVAAFRRAFPRRDEPVHLVLKTLHGDHRPRDLDRLTAAAREDGRIIVVDGGVPRGELCGMIARADAYLSLHRAEGFGRPLAEAMLLGTPVVATGWSGCADFLTPETGYPVASTLRPVAEGEYPFAAGSWAEPDIDHAARLMRQVYDDRRDRSGRIGRARARVQRDFGLETVADRLGQRLDRVRSLIEAGPGRDPPR